MNALSRLGLINWHLLPSMDIDVNGHIGVIGENRSGKSTLLDLIQVVMTGNDRRYLRLNASASDSGRKRSSRSVHAYCLGRLGPDAVSRREARTYLFLVFRNAHRPQQATTIGIALEASERETSERVHAQFIAHGRALTVSDFLYTRDDGSEGVRDWSLARPHLEKLCAEVGGSLAVYRDEPTRYVQDYLKALSTGERFIAPDHMLKAFVNAISFEQIPNATEFVRRYLLERDDIRIGQLRESIATYHDLQKHISKLREKLAALTVLHNEVSAFRSTVREHERNQWLEARAGFDAAVRVTRSLRRERDSALRMGRDAQYEIEEYARLIRDLDEEQANLQSAIASQTQGGRMQELKQQSKALGLELTTVLNSLKVLHTSVVAGATALRTQHTLETLPLTLMAALDRLVSASGSAAPPSWPADPRAVAMALDDPTLADASSAAATCRTAADRLVKEQAIPEQALLDLQAQIRDIRDKGALLDPHVSQLISELSDKGFRPRVLGHLLTVQAEDWRDAVEALLGRDREAIVVDDAHVDEAIRHLQQNRRRLRGCRIVNTRKIDSNKSTPEPNTLASVLRSDDDAAMAFVIRRIGGVRLADTLADLHQPGRAIMRDGTYDDGLTVELREVQGGYRIGAGAARASLPALEEQASALREQIAALDSRCEALRRLAGSLDTLGQAAGRGEALLTLCGQAESLQGRLDQVNTDMGDLARNINPDLGSRLEKVRETLANYRREERDASVRLAESRRTVGEITGRLNAGGDQLLGSNTQRRQAFDLWKRRKSLLPREESRTLYASSRKEARDDCERIARDARKVVFELRDEIEKRKNLIFDRTLAYHQLAGTRPDLTRETVQVMRDIAPWLDSTLSQIRDTELVQFEADAIEAAEKTRNIFQHSFAYELRARFQRLDSALHKLNRILRDHDFHYERYRFTAQPHEGMRDIIALVRASEADDTLFGLLFDQDVSADHPHAKALETVRAVLLDDSLDMSEFEDYRRYYTFNLIMKDITTNRETDLETRRGTGSGAEQQVPFYVAIGSALAAAYHDRAAGDPALEKGIGLAVFDEAFSKLDGKNQKACMDFYHKLGLQVLVAAPFEKRATLYETMDTFIETLRHDDQVDIECYGIRPRARQAFVQANPLNQGFEAFQMAFGEGEAPAANRDV